jgi:hypothetical protein
MENGSAVYLAGWGVTNNSITKGTLGEDDSFYMYSSNYGTGEYFGSTSSENWSLGIGSKFGVTNKGGLYCENINITGGTLEFSGQSTIEAPSDATTGTTTPYTIMRMGDEN